MEKPYEVRINLKDVRQLFNSFDPAPFLERDLDDDASEYIVDSVKEVSLKRPMRIVILLPEDQINQDLKDDIQISVKHFFNYKLQVAGSKLRKHLEKGRKSLVVGIAFLASSLILSQLISNHFTGFISSIISEGLMIAGWVALWEPISIFLYDWWPIANERKVFEKIKNMRVVVKAKKAKLLKSGQSTLKI